MLELGHAVDFSNKSVCLIALVPAIVEEWPCIVECLVEVAALSVPFGEEEECLHCL